MSSWIKTFEGHGKEMYGNMDLCQTKWVLIIFTSYLHWKQQKNLFSKGQAQKTTQLLKLVDSDVCGPTQTQFKEKMTFFLT
jgi:hypothetical protein